VKLAVYIILFGSLTYIAAILYIFHPRHVYNFEKDKYLHLFNNSDCVLMITHCLLLFEGFLHANVTQIHLSVAINLLQSASFCFLAVNLISSINCEVYIVVWVMAVIMRSEFNYMYYKACGATLYNNKRYAAKRVASVLTKLIIQQLITFSFLFKILYNRFPTTNYWDVLLLSILNLFLYIFGLKVEAVPVKLLSIAVSVLIAYFCLKSSIIYISVKNFGYVDESTTMEKFRVQQNLLFVLLEIIYIYSLAKDLFYFIENRRERISEPKKKKIPLE